MIPELDAIRARAEWAKQVAHDLDVNAFVTFRDSAEDVPRLVAALEAVMELHKEVGNAGIDGCGCGCGGYEPWCSCGQGDYPCPTVAAVERALKEEQ